MTSSSTDLGPVIDVLEDMRRVGIVAGYAIGGAVAGILHYEPISTLDLDIFFVFARRQQAAVLSLEEIYDYAREHEFKFDHEFIYVHGWLVQFVEASHDPLWMEAISTARVLLIDGRDVRVIGPEHLAAMWAQAGRKKDTRKIEMFDEGKVMDSGKLLDVLTRFGLLSKWRSIQSGFSNEYQF